MRDDRQWPRWFAAAVLVLLVNTAYLAAFDSPTAFYFANVVAHMLLGIALAIVCVRALIGRFRPASFATQIGWMLLASGAVAGMAIMIVGAYGPYRWLLPLHITFTVAGLLPLLLQWARAALQRGRARRSIVAGATVLVATAAAIATVRGAGIRSDRDVITNPAVIPETMEQEGGGPKGPFFPSSSETNTGGVIPATFFMTSESCGRCHTDIYNQWKASAHHFSSFNNQWYRKSIEYMQDVVGTRPSKWCAGCHDHAVFFNGRFDRPIKEQIDTPEAQAGLACTSCHAITRVKSTMGQGDFEVTYPPLHDLAASDNPLLRFVHDRLTYIDPAPHRATFLKPFHREQTPEFCSSCHKVHLDAPVNNYRWFRGFNDYDNWQASAVSGQGARSFYYPPQPQTCKDCHMPLVHSADPAADRGQARSHRFAAANTALPFANRDPEQLAAVQNFLRDGQITVDVFGLVRGEPPAAAPAARKTATEPELSSTFAVGEESGAFGPSTTVLVPPSDVIAPLDKVDAWVQAGESVRVEVVVRTRKVGHFFPGGTVDAFDVWVEFEATDEAGHTLLHSGSVADDGRGPVDPGAHFYRSLLIDERGNPINKRNAWAARSVAYVRLIPPGAADTVHYRLQVPPTASGRIRLKARVNYRKFAWWNTQWAFAGVRDPGQPAFSLAPGHDDGRWLFNGSTAGVSGAVKAIPDIPTTVMAEAAASLRVVPTGQRPAETAALRTPAVRERWNDYGIGLLLQGDTKGAEAAFLHVTTMEPGYADGWVNVARARIQEGDMDGAEKMLRQALSIDAKLAKSHFFLGTVLKNLGRYDEALAELREAGAQYPRDRVVLNQLGRVHFLQRDFAAAIGAFTRVLTIDPEDLQAHYNLMLCYQGSGDTAGVERERALYMRFKADEPSQAITGPYRQLHAEDNNERQQIHEHRPSS